MNNDKRIYLSPPHLGTEEQKYVQEAFASNWVAPLGPNVTKFEDELAKLVNTKSALALSSGTAALHLALEVLNVSKGDIVFCSSFTFVASANPITYVNATPVFIDSDEETWNMSPSALRRAFEEASKNKKLPKAVIVVNLYGQSANFDEINKICKAYDVPIIEDAAESLGSTYRGKQSGTLGKLGVFSFNGNKIITTSGGGMLISDDSELINKARFLSTQARENVLHYEHKETGYNYRLSNVLAGVGRGQLKVLKDRVLARRKIFQKYKKALSTIPGVTFMPEASYGKSNHWLTTLTVRDKQTRDKIIKLLDNFNIEARPLWKPLHLQPLFKDHQYYPHTNKISISDDLFSRGLCLPSGSSLSNEEQEKIISLVQKCLDKEEKK